MLSKAVLKNKDKNGLYSVYIQYIHGGKTKRFATGCKVPVSYWNEEKQQIKKDGTENHTKDNIHISNIKGKVDGIIKGYYEKFGKAPSVSVLETEYNNLNKTIETEKNLIDFLTQFIDRKKTNQELSLNTLKSFTQLKNNLTEFTSLNKINPNFESIDRTFFDNLRTYYINKGHKNTTTSKRLKVFKEFLNDGLKMGYHANQISKEYQIKLQKVRDKEVVTLDLDELKAFKELDLSHNKRLERVRDLFLLQSFTGLRYSDVVRLNKSFVYNDRISLTATKTKSNVTIPLFDVAKEILEKYDYQIKKISNDKYNEYLKEVCQLVPSLVETTITQQHYIGNQPTEITEPKYKFIGTHTARRNFVTMLIDSDVKIPQIMLWSGHKSLAMFQGYINRKQGEQAEIHKVTGLLN